MKTENKLLVAARWYQLMLPGGSFFGQRKELQFLKTMVQSRCLGEGFSFNAGKTDRKMAVNIVKLEYTENLLFQEDCSACTICNDGEDYMKKPKGCYSDPHYTWLRVAIWQAYDYTDYYNGETISFREMEIDHIVS